MRKELSDEVKAKLRKILALAESGIDGEREAAKKSSSESSTRGKYFIGTSLVSS